MGRGGGTHSGSPLQGSSFFGNVEECFPVMQSRGMCSLRAWVSMIEAELLQYMKACIAQAQSCVGLQVALVTYLGTVGKEEASIWQQRQLIHLHAQKKSCPTEHRLHCAAFRTAASAHTCCIWDRVDTANWTVQKTWAPYGVPHEGS